MNVKIATILGLQLVQAVLGSLILHETQTVEDLSLQTYKIQQHSLTGDVELANKPGMQMNFFEGVNREIHQRKNRKILQDCTSNTSATGCAPATAQGEAFLGPSLESNQSNLFELETIIGADDRLRVKNTEEYPYRTIGRLFFRCAGAAKICTATLIGPNTIITSAHCVYSRRDGVECDSFEFSAGQQADYQPFGTAKATDWFYPQQYVNTGNIEYDYAVLTLDSAMGDEAGWMGLGYSCSNTIQDLQTAGYPSDKSQFRTYMFQAECNEQQLNACPCLDQNEEQKCPFGSKSVTFRHTCDTYAGQSGSPVWAEVAPNVYQIRGIHSGQITIYPDNAQSFTRNQAVATGQFMYDFVNEYL